MAQHTNSISVEFTGSHSVSGWVASDYGVMVNLVQTYQDDSRYSTISLDSIQIKRVGNAETWSGLPIFGSVYVSYGGSTTNLVSLDNTNSGHIAKIKVSGGDYCTWEEYSVTKSTASIKHNTDGNATITVGLTAGYTVSDKSYFGAKAVQNGSENVFGVESASKPATLANVGHYMTVNPNGGTWSGSPAIKSYRQVIGTNFPITDPVKTGNDFTGWTLTGGGSFDAGTKKYTYGSADGMLKAGWTATTYTVSYNANGGSGAPASQTKTHGTALTLSSTVPTRTGFSFLGWALTSDAVSAQYQPGGSYTTNASATLYAVWKVISFTLSATISPLGITTNILRTASPTGYGSIEQLSSGATLYYGDVVKISWTLQSGYLADTLTVNSVDVSAYSPAEDTETITEDLFVVLTVKTGGIVYITNQPYQAFIWSGSAWEQYEAYIYNGAAWDAY